MATYRGKFPHDLTNDDFDLGLTRGASPHEIAFDFEMLDELSEPVDSFLSWSNK